MERILVVEDDPALRRGLIDNLRCESYEVVSASDGPTACQLIKSAQPDLVVLDLTLPGFDGLEVCRRVRSAGLRTPIVMLTARGEESDRVNGLELGADDYLSKPFSLPELFARIRSILRHRRAWLTETNELRQDLRSASEVQRRLFPRGRPAIGSIDFAGACLPARVVGGDYFDYFATSDSQLAMLVADVAGKGAAAALLMANLQGSVRSSAPSLGDRCDHVASHLNEALFATTDDTRYATLFYAVLDPDTGSLTYVNAGHVPALLVSSDGTACELPADAPPIGLFETVPFASQHRVLDRGTWLVIYSDGISEAVDDHDADFGRERLADIVRQHRDRSASELCDATLRMVAEHAGNRPQHDDLTIVAARLV